MLYEKRKKIGTIGILAKKEAEISIQENHIHSERPKHDHPTSQILLSQKDSEVMASLSSKIETVDRYPQHINAKSIDIEPCQFQADIAAIIT